MAQDEIRPALNAVVWVLLFLGVLLAIRQARQGRDPEITWQRVAMDGHRTGAKCVTAENLNTALGVFTDNGYTAPGGVVFPEDSPVPEVASALMDAQPRLSGLKVVVGHSARMMMNLRTDPDLPLGNLFADILRARGSRDFKVPMDFAVTNFGGIRCPMPEGAITLEDIQSMFPFKNYMCYVQMKGSNLMRLLQQLAGTKAFQAVSGVRVKVKDHQIVEALIGGREIDPGKVYNVTTIDFLLDGGDRIAIGALAEKVVLTHTLLKDVMLDYVKECEAKGILVDGAADGRVVME
ncbi:MAG: 5'-nucleotidase C-terminal domain-containing protein [Bacteroidales bacterium]|nr:5'-nucleotidase C-terminal domain-containing protein [Bacteroidales bacterium]